MVVRFLLAVITLVASMSAQASAVASVDRAVVEEGGTIRLTIETDGPTVEPEALDIIRESFAITGTHETSNFTFVDGIESIAKKVILTLIPRKLGQLTIPSIDAGSEQTQPISITVTELTEKFKREIARHAFIEVDVEPKTQYVHAPIRVTRRLYYSVSAQADERLPSLTKLDDARVIVTKPEYMSSAVVDGTNYNLVSQEFIVYPAKSGTMFLPAFTVSVYLPVSGFQRRYQDRRISFDEIKLEILPVPTTFPADKPWFPAYDVQLARALTPDDLSDFKVGDSFRDEVTITALGSYGAAIPPLDYGVIDGIRVYPDSPLISDGVKDGESLGSHYQSTNFVVSAAGDSTIAPLEISWWNLNTNKVETARLPEIQVFAKSAPTVVQVPERQSAPQSEPSVAADSSVASGESQPLESVAALPSGNNEIQWVQLALAVIGGTLIGTAFTLGWSRARRRPALARIDHAGSLRRLESQLNSSEAPERKRLVLEWLSKTKGVDEHIAARALMSDSEGAQLLSNLNAAIYSDHPSPLQASAAHIIVLLKRLVEQEHTAEGMVPGLYELQAAR